MTYFSQRAAPPIEQTEAQLNQVALALVQSSQRLVNTLFQLMMRSNLCGRGRNLILHKVTQRIIPILANRSLQTDGLLTGLEDMLYMLYVGAHLLGDLFNAGFAAQLLKQAGAHTHRAIDRFNKVDW